MSEPDRTDSMNGWYAVVDGKPHGPLSRAEVIGMIGKGAVRPDTRVWRAGMEDWAAASSFVEFAGHFASREASAQPPAAQPLPRTPTPRPLDLGRAVEDGVAAFRRAPWRACAGALTYVLPVFAVNSLLVFRLSVGGGEAAAPSTAEVALWLMGMLIVAVVLRAGLCLFTLRLLRGDAASPALVFAGVARIVVLAPYALLYGAAVFGGMLFLILPGIFLAVVFSLGFYIIMESRLGPLAAMRESWRAVMTLGWWPVFAVYLVSFLGVIALALISGVVGFMFGAPLFGEIAQVVFVAGWTAVTALVIAAVYEQARQNRERASSATGA